MLHRDSEVIETTAKSRNAGSAGVDAPRAAGASYELESPRQCSNASGVSLKGDFYAMDGDVGRN